MKEFFKNLKSKKLILFVLSLAALLAVIVFMPHFAFAAGAVKAVLWISPDFSELSKSRGGATFSKNHYGNFSRKKVKGINRNSPAQAVVRANFSTNIKAWKDLSRLNIDSWNLLAPQIPIRGKLARTIYYTGEVLYNSLNRYLSSVGQPSIESAPNINANNVASMVGSSVVVNTTPGTEDITITLSAVPATGFFVTVWASGIVSNGISYMKKYKMIGVLDSTFASPGSIKAMYLSVFDQMPATGETVWFQLQQVDGATGFHSLKFQTGPVVGGLMV
jgi:hypothetical protein